MKKFMLVATMAVPVVAVLAFIWYVALSLGDEARLGVEYSVAHAVIATVSVVLLILIALKLTRNNDDTNK